MKTCQKHSAVSLKGLPLAKFDTLHIKQETISPYLYKGYTNNKEERKALAYCRMSINAEGIMELEDHHSATIKLMDSTKNQK